MQHSFDISIAKQYGIESAIILNNLHFWHERNKANNKHFYDGKYWIYNSVTAWMDLFPYLSRDKIKNALSKLREHKLVESANYNESKYDKTLWYGLTDFALSILQKSPMDFANTVNPIVDNAKPIPIINTIDKTTIINNKTNATKVAGDISEVYGYFNQVNQTNHNGDKKVTKGLQNILKEHSIESVKLVIDYMANGDTYDWFRKTGQNTISKLSEQTKFYEKLEKAELWQKIYNPAPPLQLMKIIYNDFIDKFVVYQYMPEAGGDLYCGESIPLDEIDNNPNIYKIIQDDRNK